MHFLSDSFIKPLGLVKVKGQLLYRFDIFYQRKAREYYVENNSDFHRWINQLWNATAYSEVFQRYDIIETIKSCTSSQIIKVKCKNNESDQLYCLKSVSKKDISLRDLEDIKIETEIMKVCHHPNIVKLFNVYESLEANYLGKTIS